MPNLLAKGTTNAKTAKSESTQGKYTTSILYMLPNPTICPNATSCMKVCLQSAGMGSFSNVRKARRRKTLMYLRKPTEFYAQLASEVLRAQIAAGKKGKRATIRLNGTSDIDHTGLIQRFPAVQFYDYTKVIERAYAVRASKVSNYHLTVSRTEHNERQAFKALRDGVANVAVVFRTPKDKSLPETYKGFPVVDGRTHDLRFLDPQGVIVGLSALGKAKKDNSGFVVDWCDGKEAIWQAEQVLSARIDAAKEVRKYGA